MSLMYNLTKQQMAMALNLALVLDCGLIPVHRVVSLLKQDFKLTQRITEFWMDFNDTTRRALDMVIIETLRQSLEVCYNKTATGYPEIEN